MNTEIGVNIKGFFSRAMEKSRKHVLLTKEHLYIHTKKKLQRKLPRQLYFSDIHGTSQVGQRYFHLPLMAFSKVSQWNNYVFHNYICISIRGRGSDVFSSDQWVSQILAGNPFQEWQLDGTIHGSRRFKRNRIFKQQQ